MYKITRKRKRERVYNIIYSQLGNEVLTPLYISYTLHKVHNIEDKSL